MHQSRIMKHLILNVNLSTLPEQDYRCIPQNFSLRPDRGWTEDEGEAPIHHYGRSELYLSCPQTDVPKAVWQIHGQQRLLHFLIERLC